MSETNQPTQDTHVDVRTTYAKKENEWKYVNTSLVRKWQVKREANLINLGIKINNVLIRPSSKTETHFVFDFGALRKKWFELLGETSYECDLMALEDACMYAQLSAITHFSKTPKELLRTSLFTDGMTIVFVPEWKARTTNNPTRLEVQETFCISDIHKQTYTKKANLNLAS